jgi:DNA-binding CsgD family transcriptional regulator
VTASRGDENATALHSARTGLVPEPDALETAVRASLLSVVLFDVERARLIAISPRAERDLDLIDVDFDTFDLVKSSSNPEGVRELLTWIQRGTAKEWTWRSRLRSPDGAIYFADAVVRAVGGTLSRPRRCIAFYPSAPAPGTEHNIVESFGDLTVGSVGADGHIECVRSVAPGLEFAPRRVSPTARPLELHGDDAIRIEKATRLILEDAICVSTVARVRDAAGPWRGVRVTLEQTVDGAEDPDDPLLPPAHEQHQFAQQRIIELERYLRRIARAVEAAGYTPASVVPDASSVPGLEDLSARQWEVVTRLFRGERVATIARDMFLSQSTVRNHLASIYRRLGVRSQAELLEKLHAATAHR